MVLERIAQVSQSNQIIRQKETKLIIIWDSGATATQLNIYISTANHIKFLEGIKKSFSKQRQKRNWKLRKKLNKKRMWKKSKERARQGNNKEKSELVKSFG